VRTRARSAHRSKVRWGALRSVAALAVPATSPAQDSLTIEQAAEHIGEEATVCGTVVQTVFIENDRRQPTYLNFGQPWPDHVFNVLILGRHRPRFLQPPEETYADQEICVEGLLEEADGVPQIGVRRPEQITLVERDEEMATAYPSR
jgi:hypothetical protein